MAPLPYPLLEEDLYEPAVFVNTDSIEVLANRPRFGRPSDITVMFDRTASQEEQKDYVTGVFLFSVVALFIHAVWLIILLILRCLGPNRVGVWSGSLPKNMRIQKRRHSKQASAADVFLEQFQLLEGNKDENPETHPEKQKLDTSDKEPIMQAQKDEKKDNEQSEVQEERRGLAGCDRIQISQSQDDDEEHVEVELELELKEKESQQEETSLNGDGNPPSLNHSDPKGLKTEEDQDDKQKMYGTDRTEVQTQEDDSKEEGINQVEEEEEGAKVQKQERTLKCFRITTWVAGVLMICFAIIFMDKGVRSLEKGMDSAKKGLLDVHDVSNEGVDIIQSYLDITDRIGVALTEGLVSDWCPKQQENVCNNNYQSEEELVGLILAGLCGTGDDNIDLEDEPKFVKDLRSLQRDLEKLAESALDAYNKLYTFTWAFWVSFLFCWLLIIVTIGRMQMTYLAAKKESRFIHESRIRCLVGVPIWFTFLICFSVFQAVFLIGGIVSSDFCYDSPDPNVLSCLSMIHGITYDATKTIEWYILGCEGESPLEDAYGQYLTNIVNGVATAHDIFDGAQQYLGESPEDVVEFCGIPVLESKFQDVDEALHHIFDALASTREYFFCETFSPLYTNLAYDSMCYEAVSGFRWVSVAAMMVTNMALLMATVRAGSAIPKEEIIEKDSDASSRPIVNQVEGEVVNECSKVEGGSQATQFYTVCEHPSPSRTKSEDLSVIDEGEDVGECSKLKAGSQATQFHTAREHPSPNRTKSEYFSVIESNANEFSA